MTLRGMRGLYLTHNLADRACRALYRGGQRITAEGPKPDDAHLWRFTRIQRKSVIVDHDPVSRTPDYRPCRGKVQLYDWDILVGDILPDVCLGPVGKWEHPNRFSRTDSGVIQIPQLRPLYLWIPSVPGRAKGENSLLGARFFFVTSCTAENDVKAIFIERLFEGF